MRMGQRWIDVDGDQVMDVEDEVSDLSESGSKDDPEEIKVLKAWYYESG